LGTLLGWLLGAVVAPYYFDSAVRLPVGLCMAFAIVCVMMFLFTERDVLLITQTSDEIYAALANTNKNVEGDASSSTHEVDPEEIRAKRLDNFAKMYELSSRETGIMVLFAAGRSAEWIASKEVISKNTVRTHLRTVYSKLDVHSRQELLDKLAEFNL
jgi:DNA-binding CsgD family transcriptional regulator